MRSAGERSSHGIAFAVKKAWAKHQKRNGHNYFIEKANKVSRNLVLRYIHIVTTRSVIPSRMCVPPLHTKPAFTLVELLAVMAIIVIIIGITVPVVTALKSSADVSGSGI